MALPILDEPGHQCARRVFNEQIERPRAGRSLGRPLSTRRRRSPLKFGVPTAAVGGAQLSAKNGFPLLLQRSNSLTEEDRNRLLAEFVLELAAGIMRQEWHWFRYHLQFLPPHPFARSIIEACIDCEVRLPALGRQLIRDVAAIGGIERHEPHYDQLMQKLAEILILRQLLSLPWPEGTMFQHEPSLTPDGKRPELRVRTVERSYLFEVKTPSLTAHARSRAINNLQAPARMFERPLLNQLAAGGGLTLPRDNPVKDFLIDADKKFAPFKEVEPTTSILIVVWDDHIYEPITVLTQEQCGLLTPNSYFRNENGEAKKFANIDAIVLVRHLLYFKNAAGDAPLIDRAHAFDFGNHQALPNVRISAHGPEVAPEFILQGLRARSLDDPILQRSAEYQPIEMVFWMNLDE